jgi:1,3-beta-glucan synthase
LSSDYYNAGQHGEYGQQGDGYYNDGRGGYDDEYYGDQYYGGYLPSWVVPVVLTFA